MEVDIGYDVIKAIYFLECGEVISWCHFNHIEGSGEKTNINKAKSLTAQTYTDIKQVIYSHQYTLLAFLFILECLYSITFH